MSNRDTALNFVKAFCGGDIEEIESTLGRQFSLSGPLFTFDSKEAYLSSLNADPPVPGPYKIISVMELSDCVSIYYTYQRHSESITIAQLFWMENEKISKTLLVFDRPNA